MDIKLSACTIVKNEEKNIGRSIESYKKYVDEIIIVDTGSTDDTVKIAENLGAKVLHFEWINDFAAAKNFALDNATGNWIIFLDADEWFDNGTAKNIKKAIESSVNSGYFASASKMVNFSNQTEILETGTTTRIFKRDANIRFKRPIHETLFDLKNDVALPALYSGEYVINHSGYMRDIVNDKSARNMVLLNKNYASGNIAPIDYFYVMRENLQHNMTITDHLFRTISLMPDYKKEIKEYNLGSNLDEMLVKVSNILSNELPFSERMAILKQAQEDNPGDPLFKYYEYLMFLNIDKEKAIESLKEAINLDESFGKGNAGKNNAFCAKKGEAYTALGEYYILTNDNMLALDAFTKSTKCQTENKDTLMGLLSIVGAQKPDDVVIFLNSIYDTENKDTLRFLVEALRLTPYFDVFLFYFVKWHKLFNEIDQSFFTSRMITGNYDEIIDTYVKVYVEGKNEKALMFITAALIASNNKEKYEKLASVITPDFSRILNCYFNHEKIENPTDREYEIFGVVYKEIAYIANEEAILKLTDTMNLLKENAIFDVIKNYYSNYSYEQAKSWTIKASNEIKSRDFIAFSNFILTNIYFREENFDELEKTLDVVVHKGYLSQDIEILCKKLEATDDDLEEYLSLCKENRSVMTLALLDKIEDTQTDSIKFMSIDKLKDDVTNKNISIITEQIKQFYDFAEKSFSQKAYGYAEKYYKLVIKNNYNIANSYYKLGIIYNNFGKPDLSFYCYEKAFTEDLILAQKVLPQKHKNVNYIYQKRPEINQTKCPICGKNAREKHTYTNIDDSELSYNDVPIAMYMYCDSCNHIFAKNRLENEKMWEDVKNTEISSKRIANCYSIFDRISSKISGTKFLEISQYPEMLKVAENLGYKVDVGLHGKDKYDIIHMNNILENSNDIKDLLKKCIMQLKDTGTVIIETYDINNAFSTLASAKPLWVRHNLRNAFSRNSIKLLLDKSGLSVEDIFLGEEGKIVIIAKKQEA